MTRLIISWVQLGKGRRASGVAVPGSIGEGAVKSGTNINISKEKK
jgi:hypothetical protein